MLGNRCLLLQGKGTPDQRAEDEAQCGWAKKGDGKRTGRQVREGWSGARAERENAFRRRSHSGAGEESGSCSEVHCMLCGKVVRKQQDLRRRAGVEAIGKESQESSLKEEASQTAASQRQQVVVCCLWGDGKQARRGKVRGGAMPRPSGGQDAGEH